MYCSNCGAEYREGFAECSDCLIPLVAEKPQELDAGGDPGLEWVTVLSGDTLLIYSARQLLEQAGIPCYVTGDEIGPRVIGLHNQWRRICVGRDREAEARAIVASFEEADPNGEEPE